MKKTDDILTHQTDFPKGNPFEVPEGYFEMLEERIESRIHSEMTIKPTSTKIIQILKPILGLAASFAIAFLLIYYPLGKILPRFMGQNNQSEEQLFEMEYLGNNFQIDDNTLLQVLSTTENHAEYGNEEVISFVTEELSDYEIYAEILN